MNDVPATVAAATSGVTGGAALWLTYVEQANAIVSLLAGIVAVVAGLYAIAHYRRHRK